MIIFFSVSHKENNSEKLREQEEIQDKREEQIVQLEMELKSSKKKLEELSDRKENEVHALNLKLEKEINDAHHITSTHNTCLYLDLIQKMCINPAAALGSQDELKAHLDAIAEMYRFKFLHYEHRFSEKADQVDRLEEELKESRRKLDFRDSMFYSIQEQLGKLSDRSNQLSEMLNRYLAYQIQLKSKLRLDFAEQEATLNGKQIFVLF
jgi:hypothetical protein